MIRQSNEKVKHEELENPPLPFLNIQLTVSVVYNHSKEGKCAFKKLSVFTVHGFSHTFT